MYFHHTQDPMSQHVQPKNGEKDHKTRKMYISLAFLLWWKSGETAFYFLPLLANLSVIENFLVKTQSQVLNIVCHSFQLILWKAAVNIPAKKGFLVSKAQLEARQGHRNDQSKGEVAHIGDQVSLCSCLFSTNAASFSNWSHNATIEVIMPHLTGREP